MKVNNYGLKKKKKRKCAFENTDAESKPTLTHKFAKKIKKIKKIPTCKTHKTVYWVYLRSAYFAETENFLLKIL